MNPTLCAQLFPAVPNTVRCVNIWNMAPFFCFIVFFFIFSAACSSSMIWNDTTAIATELLPQLQWCWTWQMFPSSSPTCSVTSPQTASPAWLSSSVADPALPIPQLQVHSHQVNGCVWSQEWFSRITLICLEELLGCFHCGFCIISHPYCTGASIHLCSIWLNLST